MNNNRSMVPMESLIESISMGPFGSDVKVEYMQDTGIPVIDGSNLIGIKMNERSLRFMSPERVQPLKKSLAHRGDIIVTHRGTLGQIVYVPKNTKYEEYLISQSQFRISLKKDLVDPVYFTYYFHTSEGQKRLLSFANYVGVPALAQATTNFRKLEFPLVPMEQQKKVVSILTEIDDKIENNNAICAELEAMAKLLYDYWFVQFDFPDGNGKPYKSSGGKMVWSEELKREIPEGWEVKCCSDILDVVTGKEDANFATEDGQYAFFTCGSDILKCNTYRFDGKMILLAGNGDFNVKCFEGKCNAYQRTYVLMPREEKYIGLLYQSVLRAIAALKKGSAGSIVKFITKSDVENIKLLIPHDDAMLNSFNKVFSFAEHIKKENAELSSLRDFLLPLLMNGQVTFKEADCH